MKKKNRKTRRRITHTRTYTCTNDVRRAQPCSGLPKFLWRVPWALRRTARVCYPPPITVKTFHAVTLVPSGYIIYTPSGLLYVHISRISATQKPFGLVPKTPPQRTGDGGGGEWARRASVLSVSTVFAAVAPPQHLRTSAASLLSRVVLAGIVRCVRWTRPFCTIHSDPPATRIERSARNARPWKGPVTFGARVTFNRHG